MTPGSVPTSRRAATADESDLEEVPGPEHFRPHAHRWRPPVAVAKTATTGDTMTLKFGDERVEGVWNADGRLVDTRLAVFRVPLERDTSVAQIVKQGGDHLYVHDEEEFIGRGRFADVGHLDLSRDSKFADVKAALLREFQIYKVVCDNLSERRNAALDTWVECMGKVVKERNLRDVLELYNIYRNFAGAKGNRDLEILEFMAGASSLSGELKEVSHRLAFEERKIHNRNKSIRSFTEQTRARLQLSGILQQLSGVYLKVSENHYKSLEDEFRHAGCLAEAIATDLTSVKHNPLLLLRFGVGDVKVFTILSSTAEQFHASPHLQTAFRGIWRGFFKSVVESDTLQTRITPVYPFLFKSFMEAITEISAKTGAEVCGREKPLLLVTSDSWDLNAIKRSNDVLDQLVENECRFLVHMAGHAKPGVTLTTDTILKCVTCTPQGDKPVSAKKKLGTILLKMVTTAIKQLAPSGNDSGLPLESLVWVTVIRHSLTYLREQSRPPAEQAEQSPYEELVASLDDAYLNYVGSCDSSESCRVMAREIVKFAAQMRELAAHILRPADVALLRSQAGFVRALMSAHAPHDAKYLPALIAELVRYWRNRESFDASLGNKSTYRKFSADLEWMCDVLHATLNVVIVKVHVRVDPGLIIDYLRSVNDFLANFEAVDFQWLVDMNALPADVFGASTAVEIVGTKSTTRRFRIADHAALAQRLLDAQLAVPKHYTLAVASRLTVLVAKCLGPDAPDDEAVCVRATGNLLTAITRALVHLDDQVNYASFEQFETDICRPFEQIAKEMVPYEIFKHHLDNLENFYVYTRKQDEIDIDTALAQCGATTASNSDGFDKAFDADLLKRAFVKYDDRFNECVQLSQADILATVLATRTKIKQSAERAGRKRSKSAGWDAAFKSEQVPLLLAGVAALWSKRESVYVSTTGRSIKPHCIQVLCVLRLLAADRQRAGLRHHLAEVLTGQGKSLVLGLLASVLALTGRPVQLVCYSKYLAKRDEAAFREFFQLLDVSSEISYGTFGDLANKVLCIEVNGQGRNARALIEEMVLNTLEAGSGGELNSRNKSTVLLVDEVDVFFTQQFYGSVYWLCQTPGMEALLKIQETIWEMVAAEPDAARVRQKVMACVEDIAVADSDKIFSQFYTSTPRSFVEMHLDKMIGDARRVRNGTDADWFINRYRLDEAGCIEYRTADGLYTKYTFSSYLNVFNYFRLKKTAFDHKSFHNYGYLQVNAGKVSYAQLPLEYDVILGVSGTISTLSREEKTAAQDAYCIKDVTCMPTFFGGASLKFNPLVNFAIHDAESDWQDAIRRSIVTVQTQGRAVLVFFDSELDIGRFRGRFDNELTRVETLTGNEAATDLARRINDAGVAGTVTLAIRAMGRGVDYKTSNVVETKGGVHVVQTFLSLDVKEEVQIKGRTARKDNKGSYELILCKKHLVKDGFLSDEPGLVTYNRLDGIRKKKQAENYKEIGQKIQDALSEHNASLEMVKSFAGYKRVERSGYFAKYPFLTVD